MNTDFVETVEINLLTYGGDGLARLKDGRAVFVPYVIPGEKVRVRIVEDGKRFARGEVVEILEASAERIQPECPHFGVCGGCHYQHIAYDAQLCYKRAILHDQLTRIGKLKDVGEISVFPSEKPFGYRNVIQFHPSANGKMGFKKWKSEEVFEIERCLLPEDIIREFWQYLQFEADTGIERVEVRQNKEGELMVVLQGADAEIPEIAVDMPISMAHQVGDEVIILSGDEGIVMRVKDVPFHLSAGAFFQVNSGIAEKMVDRLVGVVKTVGPRTVLDMYAGAGLFSRFMAPHVDNLIAIESSEQACRDFAVNLDAFNGIALYEGAVEQVLPALDLDAEMAVCDPPRAGLHVDVVDTLGRSSIEKLVYISCDPATLARDVKRLVEKGFVVEDVALFDMFPQTYHFESMLLLNRG